MKLSVQPLSGPLALRALATEVDRLASAMRPRVPFASGAWLDLWWEHFKEARLLVRDRFFVHALRDEHGKLVALAPLMLTERPSAGPLRVRILSFLGADKNITELRGLVCAPEHEGAAARALLEYLRAHRHEWDWLTWDGVRKDAEAYALLSAEGDFEWRREVVSHVLSLPSSWEEFRQTRSRNIKESLRKCYNSLKRDQLSFDFRVVETAAELPAALQACLALHTLRAGAKDLVDHADYLKDPPAQRLLGDLARQPERAPGLRVMELRVGEQLVASRLAFLLEDELYLFFSGFDPAWARYSVMTTTVAEAIKWAIGRGLRSVNLSTGNDVSKTRWSPDPVVGCRGLLVSPTRSARVKRELFTELDRRSRHAGPLSSALKFARRGG